MSDETAAGFAELEIEKARLGADPGEEEDEAEADEAARADNFTRFIGSWLEKMGMRMRRIC